MVLHDQNQQSLNRLNRIITKINNQKFSLNFVWCNDSETSTAMLIQLELTLTDDEYRVLRLDPTTQSLHRAILSSIESDQPKALIVVGLETVVDIDNLITRANLTRDQFLGDFSFPLILWANDSVSKKLGRIAPDFNSWGTSINFTTEDT